MFGIGVQELAVILVIALLIFGPKRLPELARTVGKGLAEFRRASNDLRRTVSFELDPPPSARPAPSPVPTPSAQPPPDPRTDRDADASPSQIVGMPDEDDEAGTGDTVLHREEEAGGEPAPSSEPDPASPDRRGE